MITKDLNFSFDSRLGKITVKKAIWDNKVVFKIELDGLLYDGKLKKKKLILTNQFFKHSISLDKDMLFLLRSIRDQITNEVTKIRHTESFKIPNKIIIGSQPEYRVTFTGLTDIGEKPEEYNIFAQMVLGFIRVLFKSGADLKFLYGDFDVFDLEGNSWLEIPTNIFTQRALEYLEKTYIEGRDKNDNRNQ